MRCWPRNVGWADGLMRLLGLCVATYALLAGCTGMTPSPESGLVPMTAEELKTLLREREAAIHSMKGLFSAKVQGGLIPLATRVEGVVYYRRPNAVRLRGFTPIGSELFELVQMDDQYRLRLPLQGKVYTGRPSDIQDQGKLARLSQLSVWAVGGVLGTGSIADDETAEVVEDGNRYRLDVYGGTKATFASSRVLVRRLWFDRRLLVVQEDRFGPDGAVDATIQYDDFRPLDGPIDGSTQAMADKDMQLLRPFKILLEDGRGQGTVQVTFHELHHNQRMSAEDLGQVL